MMTVRAFLAAGGLLAVLAISPALAAQDADREPVKVADALRAVAASADAEPEAYACNKARRRLWIEGEGWVVRRITTCR